MNKLHMKGRIVQLIDDQVYFGAGRVLFKFRLNDFGRQRMLDTVLFL